MQETQPAPPKRPVTAFILYCQDMRQRFREENPDVKETEMSKMLGYRWKELDEAEKAIYQERAQEAKRVYEQELGEYNLRYNRGKQSSEEEELPVAPTQEAPRSHILPESPAYEILIRYLAKNIAGEHLREAFEGCEDVFVCRNRYGDSLGTAFLKFKDESSIQQSKTNMEPSSTRRILKDPSGQQVIAYNVDPDTEVGELRRIFEDCGQVTSFAAETRGCVIVNFANEQGALNAMRLHGLDQNGSSMRVYRPYDIQNNTTSGDLFGKTMNKNRTGLEGLGVSFGGGFGGSGFGFGGFGGLRKVEEAVVSEVKAPVVKMKAQSILERLYTSKKFADVTFEVQGEKILAHKYVLSDRSKYFADLLSEDELAQPNMKTITITDVNIITFKALLEYMYCEEVKPDEDLAIDLIRLSEKYVIPDLKLKCEEILGSLISAKNFSKIAKVIEELQTAQLKESLLNFSAQNGIGMIDKKDMDEVPKTILVDILQKLSSLNKKIFR